MGKDDETFGQSLEIQSEVIDFLCPNGVTLDVQEELMESATDVRALPCKLKGDDASSTMEALGDACYSLGYEQPSGSSQEHYSPGNVVADL